MDYRKRFGSSVLWMILAVCFAAGVLFSGGCDKGSSESKMECKKNLAKTGKTAKCETVRDRFWIWGHDAGVYNGDWGLDANSRMTPVEGAYYMGVPNMIFVQYQGKPAMPFEQYAIPMRPLKNIYWSIVGAAGETQVSSQSEKQAVLNLAAQMPNIKGVFMDDFFTGKKGKAGALSVEQLKKLREELNNVGGRRLDLAVTLYTKHLDPNIILSHIDLCDVLTLWTWRSDELTDLESNFAKLKQMAPKKRILLGCYMWDFGRKKAIPIETMQRQCELGLKWLKEGQIEGMIFLATPLCDLNLETVEWTRNWIAKVGDEPL
jgi:hypothetical protein